MSIATNPAAAEQRVIRLDPHRVKPFADQPRKRFRGIPKLAKSIQAVGQITPIIVTPCDEPGFDAELVDGERRLQACRLAGLAIQAQVDGGVSARDRFAMAVAANFCRQPHDCLEIAEACERLRSQGRTIDDICDIFGKTRTFVAQHLSLRKLHPDVQEMLKRAGDEVKLTKRERRARGRMTLSIALLLLALPPARQASAARTIARAQMSMSAARNFVASLAARRGVQVGKRITPNQRFQAICNQTETYRNAIERYALMRHAEWPAVLEAVPGRQRRALAVQLRQLAEDLGGIADVIEKDAV